MSALHKVDFSLGQGINSRLTFLEKIEQLCRPKGRRAGARSKKRSLYIVSEYFETLYNAAITENMPYAM